MGYILTRLIIFLIVVIAAFFIMRKVLKKIGFSILFSLIIGLSIAIIFYFIPIENIVYTFPTQEKAINYVTRGAPQLIMEGEQSVVVTYKDMHGYCPSIAIRKTQNGYKIYSGNGLKLEGYFSSSENSTIPIYRASNTTDYYLLDLSNIQPDFSDSYGSFFTSKKCYSFVSGSTIGDIFLTGVKLNYNGPIEEYSFYLNGETYSYHGRHAFFK